MEAFQFQQIQVTLRYGLSLFFYFHYLFESTAARTPPELIWPKLGFERDYQTFRHQL
jgi:hypothetical protein